MRGSNIFFFHFKACEEHQNSEIPPYFQTNINIPDDRISVFLKWNYTPYLYIYLFVFYVFVGCHLHLYDFQIVITRVK